MLLSWPAKAKPTPRACDTEDSQSFCGSHILRRKTPWNAETCLKFKGKTKNGPRGISKLHNFAAVPRGKAVQDPTPRGVKGSSLYLKFKFHLIPSVQIGSSVLKNPSVSIINHPCLVLLVEVYIKCAFHPAKLNSNISTWPGMFIPKHCDFEGGEGKKTPKPCRMVPRSYKPMNYSWLYLP